jgi:Delta14-sterol reductase
MSPYISYEPYVYIMHSLRLTYTLSGHLQFWVLLLLVGYAYPTMETSGGIPSIKSVNPLPLSMIYDEYLGLITISCLFSLALSVYLYISSFQPGKILAKGGNTGYRLYDFFIGRELNPRIGSLDLKEFCELRPGLIGWLVINLGMAAKQYETKGSLSLSMLFIVLYQGLYVWDALFQERAILTTMDITTDGFGFMLAFGDLAWVPFIYSLQARYLVDHDPSFSWGSLIVISVVHFLGLYIFRYHDICIYSHTKPSTHLTYVAGLLIQKKMPSAEIPIMNRCDISHFYKLRGVPSLSLVVGGEQLGR